MKKIIQFLDITIGYSKAIGIIILLIIGLLFSLIQTALALIINTPFIAALRQSWRRGF